MIRGVHGDAEDTEHGQAAFQLRRMMAGGGREARGSATGDGTAAAGAAEGALGRDRPAASGSRWRKNATRQDLSRSAETRRVIGAAAARESPATEVSRASTAANTAPARMAAASAGSSEGVIASWVRSRRNPASSASRLPTAIAR